MVTQTKHMGLRRSCVPSKKKVFKFDWMALRMLSICCATTDNTSASMRLNSSKQAQAPDEASPLKNFQINCNVMKSVVCDRVLESRDLTWIHFIESITKFYWRSSLNFQVESDSISMSNIEYHFIQLVAWIHWNSCWNLQINWKSMDEIISTFVASVEWCS